MPENQIPRRVPPRPAPVGRGGGLQYAQWNAKYSKDYNPDGSLKGNPADGRVAPGGDYNNFKKEPPPEEKKSPEVVVSADEEYDANAITITPNRLHSYSTYTYGLTLHLLTKDSFNIMADGGQWLGNPGTFTLISSAGRWGDLVKEKNNFLRPPEFSDDFYFDGLSMETVIGLNQQSRSSNVIDVNFTLIEPYGLTLMNRLIALALRLKVPNYLANPYILQIDFFGSDDAGIEVNPIPDITKFIPIKLIECKIKVGTQGATYACRATPYNHTAFSQTVASTPVNFEIKAKKVGDFFNNTGDVANITEQSKNRDKAAQEREQVEKNTYISQADKDARKKKLTDQINAPYTVKSYTGAYNAYQLHLKNNKTILQESVLIFKIDKEIESADIVYPKQTDLKNSAMTERTDGQKQPVVQNSTKKGTPPQAGPDPSVEKFNVNAGTSIIDVVNMVMRSSTYITSQVKDPSKNIDQMMEEGKPLKWFKIIPKIKLREYDYSTHTWSHDIEVNIIPYKFHNYKHPVASKSSVDEVKKGLRKEYQYLYTGQNNDILDFGIDFDALFYTAVNVLKDNLPSLSNADKTIADKNKSSGGDPKPDEIATTIDPELVKQAQIQFNQVHPVSGDQSNIQGFNAWQNTSVLIATDIMKSVYSGARGDMINLNMRIIGDPDFIKQDDIYYSPGNDNYPAEGETYAKDGSILTDRGDIFARVKFKTPVDIDQTTGGLRNEEGYLESNFSGVYKIIKVTNELKGGKFEQVLQMIRWPEDPDKVTKQDSQSQREDKPAENTLSADKGQAFPLNNDLLKSKDPVEAPLPAPQNKASNEPVQTSRPVTGSLPKKVTPRPAALGRGNLGTPYREWEAKYGKDYNPDGTIKGLPGATKDVSKQKQIINTGEVKAIEDVFAGQLGA